MGSVRNLSAAAMSATVAAVTGTLGQHPEAANYRIGIGARIAPGPRGTSPRPAPVGERHQADRRSPS